MDIEYGGRRGGKSEKLLKTCADYASRNAVEQGRDQRVLVYRQGKGRIVTITPDTLPQLALVQLRTAERRR